MKALVGLLALLASGVLVAGQAALEPRPLPAEAPPLARPSVVLAGGPAPTSPGLGPAGIGDYAVIGERILFRPDRRLPGGAGAGTGTGVAERRVPLVLVGTFLSPRGRLALLRTDGEAQPRTVREGEEVAGWVVQAVAARAIALRSAGGEVLTLRLDPPP